MKTGNFSLSLNVKDIKKSKEFYEALGFKVFHGVESEGWLIMKGSDCNIGLFQGMFEKNLLTFNPGWDANANTLESFDDIRQIQKQLKQNGIEIGKEIDENSSGPASFMIEDPDGNPVLFDQHV